MHERTLDDILKEIAGLFKFFQVVPFWTKQP